MNFKTEMLKWADKFGDLVTWKTKKGLPENMMYKLLGISRPSHIAYMNGESDVPEYILNQVVLFNSLPPFKQFELAYSVLSDEILSVKEASDRALKAWEELTGREVMDTTSHVEFAGQFSLRNSNKELRYVIEQDPTGLGVGLLLKEYVPAYLSGGQYSLDSISNNDSAVHQTLLSKSKAELYLKSGPLAEVMEGFKDKCKQAVGFYGTAAADDTIESVAEDGFNIFLNAQKEFSRYSKFLISDAAPESNTEMKLLEQIFMFSNMEELVAESQYMPNGFALVLIQQPRFSDSFFVMIVKSGSKIYLVTDKTNYGNPLTKDFMASRNQRYNEDRLSDTYLPYQLLKLKFENNGRTVEYNESTDLITQEQGFRVLGHVKDMYAGQLLWLTFLMDEAKSLIVDNGKALPKLGYFSSHRLEHPLALENKQSGTPNLPSTYVAESGLETRTGKKLSRKHMEKVNPSLAKAVYINQWMEDLFDKEIDESSLYVPMEVYKEKGDVLCLSNLDDKGSVKSLERINTENMDYFAKERIKGKQVGLMPLPSTMVGSKEEVQLQADYIARKNKASMIQKLVNKDYKDNEDKIQKWIARNIVKNLPNFIDDLISLNHSRFFIIQDAPKHAEMGLVPINVDYMRQVHAAYLDFDDRWVEIYKTPEPSYMSRALKTRRKKEPLSRCYLTNVEDAEYRFKLQVSNVFDLEVLTGLPREKMPKQLQTWGLQSGREGGPLDKAFDPMQNVHNPWNDMRVNCSIPISVDALKAKRKELGLKGRFVAPINFYDSDHAYMALRTEFSKTEQYKALELSGLKVTKYGYSTRNRPSFSYYWRE